MKQAICKAFCDSVTVRDVPAGLALSTTSASINGDPIGFYAVGLDDGRYRLEDSGLLVPHLYAVGADLENDTRREVFEEILAEGDASLNEDTMEIVTSPIFQRDLPGAAVRFVSLLLRVSQLSMLAQEKAASTFKQDAVARLKERLGASARLREGEPVSENLSDWEPDLVIEAANRDPVALFLVQTDHRALEAMLLQSDAEKMGVPLNVVALLEREGSVQKKTRIKVANRLDAVPIYDGDEISAISRVAKEALGRNGSFVH